MSGFFLLLLLLKIPFPGAGRIHATHATRKSSVSIPAETVAILINETLSIKRKRHFNVSGIFPGTESAGREGGEIFQQKRKG